MNQVVNQVGSQVWNQVWDQVRNQVWDQVWDQVWNQVRNQVWNQVRNQVGNQIWDQVCYGSQESWFSHYETLLSYGVTAAQPLIGLQWAARATGWWWPFENVVIVTERPKAIKRNAAGKIYRIIYPDGWTVTPNYD